VIVLCSFAPAKRNSVANGSGMAGSISFSFNAVEQKDGVVIGSIQYGERPIQLMVPAGLAKLLSFSLMTDMLSLLVIMEKDPLLIGSAILSLLKKVHMSALQIFLEYMLSAPVTYR
jgi:hypothetical protein